MLPGEPSHRPVLLREALEGLALSAGDIAVDCTFGRGGHSRAMLDAIGASGLLLALDRDAEAIASAEATDFCSDARVQLVHGSFSTLGQVTEQLGWSGRVAGVLLDIGVSSPQLDQPERGFSFTKNGPLDMRMDTTRGMTAAEWLANVPELELADVLHDFGEERYARRIAREIVIRRVGEPLLTTRDLMKMIEEAVPAREKGKHPATRSFQAIRIFINRELSELEAGLIQALDVLKPGGRLVVIAFHSLEDRIVKRFMRDQERGCSARQSNELLQPLAIRRMRRIGKAIKPGRDEVMSNIRARSAVLRIAEKTAS
jgi:16S rRNA (cytosine1402-N4)-methyltransferase